MKEYSLLELTILEERIGKRIPESPEITADFTLSSDDPIYIEQKEYDLEEARKWDKKYEKEITALRKIETEIQERIIEVINQVDQEVECKHDMKLVSDSVGNRFECQKEGCDHYHL